MCMYMLLKESNLRAKKEIQTKCVEKTHKLHLEYIFLEHWSRLYTVWAACKHC